MTAPKIPAFLIPRCPRMHNLEGAGSHHRHPLVGLVLLGLISLNFDFVFCMNTYFDNAVLSAYTPFLW